MPNYNKIIIDKTKNSPINMKADFNVEDYHDFMHHTHKISDLVNDIEVGTYDDTQLREYIGILTERVFNLENKEKFKITNVPAGTIIDYRENEIRVMCPENAEWELQNVGETGNANMYHMAFKAYAPEGAVSFKEGDRGIIIDKMFTFDDAFAGTDEYGRNYSICWLALASYDQASNTWSYFGKNSSTKKYIGWDYVVEWYDANGNIIATDSIRIGLSNKDCHLVNEPYYVGKLQNQIDELANKVEELEKLINNK